MSNFMFADPILHEFESFLHYPDLGLYLATVNYYTEMVEDGFNHFITLGSRRFKFWSKQGGLINPKTGKLSFEYMLQWKDAIEASKCTFTIKPLFGAGTKTKTGKTLNLPLVGTQVTVSSSFIELHELRDLIEAFMLHIDAGRFIPLLDMNISKISKAAVHIRYHEQHEPIIINMLQKIEDENTTLGDVKVTKNKDSGKWDMFYLHEPDLSVCNIKTKWVHGVKSYRIDDFHKRPSTDPLRHPKLEVFLHDKDSKPSLNEYLELKRDMSDTLIKLLNFVKPIEYVSDNYFDANKVFEFRGKLPEWDFEKIEPIDTDDYNLWYHPEKSLSILAFVANQPQGCTEARIIGETLEIPERTLRRHINYWVDIGILTKKRKDCLHVGFESVSLWRAIKEPILQVCSFLNITFKKQWGQFFTDSGIIRRFRDNKKELMPFKITEEIKKQFVVVDDVKKANALIKQLKAEGVSHLFKIGVTSTKSNMRYSKIIN